MSFVGPAGCTNSSMLEIRAGNVVLLVLLVVFNRLDAEEYEAKHERGAERQQKAALVAHLRRSTRPWPW